MAESSSDRDPWDVPMNELVTEAEVEAHRPGGPVTVLIDGVLYRESTLEDDDDLVVNHGITFVPVDFEGLPPNPVTEMLRETAERTRPRVEWNPEIQARMVARVREEMDHMAVAFRIGGIRQAAQMVLAGIDWEHPEGVTERVPINRLADLKAALDRWDAAMTDTEETTT